MLEELLKEIARENGYPITSIRRHSHNSLVESNAERLEVIKMRGDAVPLRISIALFYLSQGSEEDAAYQISKAGGDVFYTGDCVLLGKLREIAAKQFVQVLEEDYPDGDGIAKDRRYEQLSQEACYNYIYAAEAYLRAGEHVREGIKLFNEFLKTADGVVLEEEMVQYALRTVWMVCPSLREGVDEYCQTSGIELNLPSQSRGLRVVPSFLSSRAARSELAGAGIRV